jgi:hypothetical protein
MSHSVPRRLIVGGHRGGKTTALAATALFDDTYAVAEMLGLSVHRHAVRGLRAALRERTGQDVPVADIRRRATALLEQYPVEAGLEPGWTSSDISSAIDRRTLVRDAWSRTGTEPGSLYKRYGHQPGALEWLVTLFDRFAEWAGTADPARLQGPEPADPGLAELWATYRAYLALSQRVGLVTFQELIPRAIDLLHDNRVLDAVAPRVLLLDDIHLFRPSELLFARALIRATTAVLAVSARLPTPDDPDPAMRYLATWCGALGLEAQPALPGMTLPPLVHDVEAPTATYEADAIARHIATTFREGDRFSDYAIVCFDPDLAPLLRRVLPQWGIAVDDMETRDAYGLALAPLLHGAARLLAGATMRPGELESVVRHPLFGLPPADRHLLAIAAAGVGPADADPLAILRSWLAKGLSREGRQRLRQVVEISRRLRSAVHAPSDKLRRWVAGLGLEVDLAAMTPNMMDDWARETDRVLLERWLAFMRQAERLRDRLGNPLTDLEAVDVLQATQALVEPISRRLADGVSLWQPEQLSGCTASHVWLAGLHEHALPKRQPRLPWVEPEAFGDLAWLPGLIPPERDGRAARWQQAWATLECAAGRARHELVVSWSRADSRGRRRLRSPLIEPLLSAWRGAGSEEEPSRAPDATLSGSVYRPRQPLPRLRCGDGAIGLAQSTPEPFTTSPSAIEDFLHCPRRYFYARVLNLYDVVSSPRQALGQVVHATLRELKAGADTSSIAALIDQHWPAGERHFGTRLREAVFRRLAEQAVSLVIAADTQQAEPSQFVAGEVSFRWQISDDVELRGQIDRIDRGPSGLVVLDYKLGTTSPSINMLLDMFAPPIDSSAHATWRPSDLQLPLYVLALEHGEVDAPALVPGERVAEVGLVYPLLLFTATGKPAAAGRRMIKVVNHSEPCPACQPRSGRSATGYVCRDQLRQIRDRAMIAIEAMRAGTIDPDPLEGARTCGGCAFRAICPAPQA